MAEGIIKRMTNDGRVVAFEYEEATTEFRWVEGDGLVQELQQKFVRWRKASRYDTPLKIEEWRAIPLVGG